MWQKSHKPELATYIFQDKFDDYPVNEHWFFSADPITFNPRDCSVFLHTCYKCIANIFSVHFFFSLKDPKPTASPLPCDALKARFRLVLVQPEGSVCFYSWLTHKVALKRKVTTWLIKSENQRQNTICWINIILIRSTLPLLSVKFYFVKSLKAIKWQKWFIAPIPHQKLSFKENERDVGHLLITAPESEGR